MSLRALTKTKNKLVEGIALQGEIVGNRLDKLSRAADDIAKQRQFPGFPYELNERQYEEKLDCMNRRFSVIQGPPGIANLI